MSNLPVKTYTIGEAARLIGVHLETIRRWEYSGKIRSRRTKGGQRRFTLLEIKRLKQKFRPENAYLQKPQNDNYQSRPAFFALWFLTFLILGISLFSFYLSPYPKVLSDRINNLNSRIFPAFKNLNSQISSSFFNTAHSFNREGKVIRSNFETLALGASLSAIEELNKPVRKVAGVWTLPSSRYQAIDEKSIEGWVNSKLSLLTPSAEPVINSQKKVLGVEQVILPVLEQEGPISNILQKVQSVASKIPRLFKGPPTFVVTVIQKNKNNPPSLSEKETFIKNVEIQKDLNVSGTAKVGKLITNVVDPYLIENDGAVQPTLEIKSVGDIKLESGSLKIDAGGGSLSNINSISSTSLSTGGITASSLTISGFTASGIVHTDANGLLSSSLIKKADIANDAAIEYSKLSLGNSITNGDIYSSAGISYSKLSLGNSITGGDLNSAINISTTGTLTVSGASTFNGAATFNSNVSVTTGGQLSLTRVPTSAHTGTWAIGSTTWNQSDATIYVNPASATADSNIFALSVGGSVKFDVDAEGDTYVNNLITAGNVTSASTTVAGTLSVEGNTTLGDASTDTLTINPATITLAQGSTTIDLTGAATKTLTILNSTTGQVANLDLSDGSLTIGGTSVLSNARALSNLTGISSSGTITLSGLTASRLVATDASSNLTNSITSANIAASVSDETGSGLLVFGTSPTVSTSLLTDSTTFALANTTATTVNFAGAATTLSIGASTGTTTVNNALTSTGLITASAGLTLAANQNLTLSSGTGQFSQTYTGTTTDAHTVTSNSLTTGNALKIAFTQNAALNAGSTATGLNIAEAAATNAGNTSNLISLSAAAGGTVNGINISSATGFTNFLKTPTFNLDSSGNITGVVGLTATTLTGTIQTASQTNITAVGTLTSLAVTGNVNSASGALQTNGVTRVDNSGNITAGTGSFGGAITPSLDATYDLGSAVLRFNNIYAAGDVTAGDLVFKNNFRFTENGEHSINILNPKGEVIGGFDDKGNLWMKGRITSGVGN